MEVLGIIFVCILLVFEFLLHRPKWQDPRSTQADVATLQSYQLRQSLFVNRSELALFAALNRYKPDGLHVMAKVRLEDILRVKHSEHEGRLHWLYRARIKSRHVDFVLCDASGRFLCAIELDGRSHANTEAKMLDSFKNAIFGHAGLKLLRIKIGDDFEYVSRNIWRQLY